MTSLEKWKGNLQNKATEWKSNLYLRTIAKKTDHQIEGIHTIAWEPRHTESPFNYNEAYQKAISRNIAIFGSGPKEIEFSRFTSTEDFNKYIKIHYPRSNSRKMKGDGIEGWTIDGNKVALIDYSALRTDTSLPQDHGNEESDLAYNHQQIITHEVAHVFTSNIIGKRGREIPSWFHEGLAVLVGPQDNNKSPSPQGKSLKVWLDEMDGRIPTEDELNKREGKLRPRKYSFAMQFLKWIFLNKTAHEIPLSEKDVPERNMYDEKRIKLCVDIVRLVAKGDTFEKSISDVFGINYFDAYKQFLIDLK